MPKRIVPLSHLAVKNDMPGTKDYTPYNGDGLRLLARKTLSFWFDKRFNILLCYALCGGRA